MAPHCTTSNWIRVTKLSESTLAPCIKASFADCEENSFCGDSFELGELLEVDGDLNSSIQTLLPEVVFFNYCIDFFLINR